MQQQNDIDFTLGLEERVISLKARIREMKMKIGYLDPVGRKEPKLDIPKQTVTQNSNIDAIKAKLLGRG